MKRFFLILLLISMLPFVSGQNRDEYSRMLYNAYIKGEMEQWSGIIAKMSRSYEAMPDQDLLYELCFAYYGYIGYLISIEEDKAAKAELDLAMNMTDILEEVLDGRHDVLALQGALIGYRMVLGKFKSVILGPRAMKYIKTAYETDNECFNCNTEMGNMRYYTPKILGGSKTEALPYYEKAVEILENSKLKSEHNWIYMNTVLLLADAYTETGQKDRACMLYKRLMDYEPKADWIRKDLYSRCTPQ